MVDQTRRALTGSILLPSLLLREDVRAQPASPHADVAGVRVIGLFRDAQGVRIPAGTTRVHTSGHHHVGLGAAPFVYDRALGADVAARHPQAAFVADDGRVFAIAGDAVSPEMLGAAAAYDPAVDDQPFVQATQDFAESRGIERLIFRRDYAIWAVKRHSPIEDRFAEDGHPLVVRRTVAWVGERPVRLVFFGMGGTDPEHHGFSVVREKAADAAPTALWRGGGVFLAGERDVPRATRLASFHLENITLLGQRRRTVTASNGHHDWPATPTDPVGHWDLTDKGLWIQDTVVGPITGRNASIIGFKGELFYVGGTGPPLIRWENGVFRTSNGDAFNPGGTGRYELVNVQMGDCFQACEALSGADGSRMVDCRLFDAITAFITGAPGAKRFGASYATPNRDPARPVPWTELTLTIDNVATLLLGSYVRGSIRATDCTVVMDASAGALSDVDLDLASIWDRGPQAGDGALTDALTIFGPASDHVAAPGRDAGLVHRPTAIRVRLRTARSPSAHARGPDAAWLRPFEGGGLVDADHVLVTLEDVESRLPPRIVDAAPSMPLIRTVRWRSTTGDGWMLAQTLVATKRAGVNTLRIGSPFHTLNGGEGGGLYAVAIATRPEGIETGRYADGQRLRLRHAGTTGMRFVFARAANLASGADRRLSAPGQSLDFRYSASADAWLDG